MRVFLLFVALAFPIVMSNPIFWWIVGVHHAASPAVYTETDGTTRSALLGPMSTWPDWATKPLAGTLTVSARFSASPTQPATGYGEIDLGNDPRRAVSDYAAALTASGWNVDLAEYQTVWPGMPPARTLVCTFDATFEIEGGGSRTLRGHVDLEHRTGKGRLHWIDGPALGRMQPLADMSLGSCEPRG